MKTLTTLLLSASLCGLASAADTITVYSSTQFVANGSWMDFSVAKFNTSMGTLTGVTVAVETASLSGTAEVSNLGGTSANVSVFNDIENVRGTTGLGYSTTGSTIYDTVTSPVWSTTTIPASSAQAFVIGAGQDFSFTDKIITSGYWTNYEVLGAGTVTFQAQGYATIVVEGGSYSVDSKTVGANTRFVVTYTYVPETSSALLGGLGFLALLRRRR